MSVTFFTLINTHHHFMYEYQSNGMEVDNVNGMVVDKVADVVGPTRWSASWPRWWLTR